MNRLILDQLARTINLGRKGPYSYPDLNQAHAVMSYFVDRIQAELGYCLNARENNGVCDMTWRHEDCRTLMNILYKWTEDDKYYDGIEL
jgi:hypothetical protein